MLGCTGIEACNFEVNADKMGMGPINNTCAKDFLVRYKCESDQVERQSYSYAEAHMTTVYLSCAPEQARFHYKKPIYFRKK